MPYMDSNMSFKIFYASTSPEILGVAKAAYTLNGLHDTTCMIQLVWLCKIANSYKLDAQIFVRYNC